MYIAMDMNMRKYDMRARQLAKDATRDAIIDAAIDAFEAERSFSITLPAVAERADVTVKTVLRHFGNRDALIDAAWQRLFDDIRAEREPPPDDPDTALKVLIEHYERRGTMVLAMLAQEDKDPRAQRMNSVGRRGHRAWVKQVFDTQLPEPPAARSRLVDMLVVATDVYTWKLLRHDRGLSVDDVSDRMLLMTEALLTAPTRHRTGG
ncbi:TetR/AcrR family transcriptional regulator [Mycobacterium sp. NPDC051804]|uniref:TetR/AcrR family transcriptional regulator n=1 Tax=Mycobacterium sp. NPDC051804 TaxID=3364295 RepID=UPI0037951406